MIPSKDAGPGQAEQFVAWIRLPGREWKKVGVGDTYAAAAAASDLAVLELPAGESHCDVFIGREGQPLPILPRLRQRS